jgi:small conductance mechanosensitive channel
MNDTGNPSTFFSLSPHVEVYLVRGVGAALILVLGWLALRFLVGPLRRWLDRSRLDPSAASFLVGSVRTIVIVVVLLTALQQLGVQTTSLLALLGAAGLAVALSLRGSLANFASGLLLLSSRVVRVGDLIEVGDLRGRVSEMLPFHVVLVTADNQRITVPNTLLTNGSVRNNSALPTRRVQWTLPVPARADLDAVKEALRTRLLADTRIAPDPAPQLYVQEWGEEKIVLAVTAWTETANYTAVQQELLEKLGKSLEGVRQRPGETKS